MRLQAVSAKNDASPPAVNDTPIANQRLMQDTFTPIATKPRAGQNSLINHTGALATFLAVESEKLGFPEILVF
jgi:hypothetical protein